MITVIQCNSETIVKNQLITQKKLDELAKGYIHQSLSISTRKFYGIDLRIFSNWCDSLGLIALPAAPDTIARFLAAQASQGLKPATLTRRVAAIRMSHEAQGYATPTQHKVVKTVLKGIKRAMRTTQSKKAPATAERIENMIMHCSNTLTGLRDKALLLLGFAGALRRSELVSLITNDIERTPEGLKIIIRKSKTDQEGNVKLLRF